MIVHALEVSSCSKLTWVNIASENGYRPSRSQHISWTNGDYVCCRMWGIMFINSFAPSDVFMHLMHRSTLLKEMASCPFGANPFTKPKLTTCHLERCEQLVVLYVSIQNCSLKCMHLKIPLLFLYYQLFLLTMWIKGLVDTCYSMWNGQHGISLTTDTYIVYQNGDRTVNLR